MVLNTKAFTLVELLVTVTIGGILASISAANFQAFKQRANDAVAISSAHNAFTALQAAASDTRKISGASTGGYFIDVINPNGTLVEYGDYSLVGNQLMPGYVHDENIKLFVFGEVGAGGTITGEQLEVAASHCRGTVSSNRTTVFVIYRYSQMLRAVKGSAYEGAFFRALVGMPSNGSACTS